jgi:hypothetical protein
MVERVFITLPQEQVMVTSLYSGWIPAFILNLDKIGVPPPGRIH